MKWILSLRSAPLVLLLMTVLTFGLFLGQLGFYWDDWAFAWTRSHLGAEGIYRVFSTTRPFRGVVDGFLTQLLWIKPLTWQIFSLTMRWLATVAFWWFVLQLWPQRRHLATLAALLFLVYPGFTQQPMAMTYNYFWGFEALFFLSLGWMVWGIHNRRSRFPALTASLFLSGLQLFAMEYLFGLELLRPIFLWLALKNETPEAKKRLAHTFSYYIPFALVSALYLYWRLVLYSDSRYQPVLTQNFTGANSSTALLEMLPRTLFEVSVKAWGHIIEQPSLRESGLTFLAAYVFVVLGSLVGLIFYMKKTDKEVESHDRDLWEWLAVGILTLLAAGLPFYIAGLQVSLDSPHADRFSLPFMFGVSLFLAGTLGFLKDSSLRIALASAVIALAAGYHLHVADLYRADWKTQKAFLWQLAWRVPGLKPGTAIFSEDVGTFSFNDDEAMTYAVNWIYEPENPPEKFPYALFFVSARLKQNFAALEKNIPVQMDYGARVFEGNTSQIVVLYFSPPSCLRILDPAYDTNLVAVRPGEKGAARRENTEVQLLPRYTLQAMPLSRLDLIVPDPDQSATPPEFLIGYEPEHQWCYFFEKAELSRQQGNWEEVAGIGDNAFSIPYYPNDLSEYLIFIEAYARLGRLKDAFELSDRVKDAAPVLLPAMCDVWRRVESLPTSSGITTAGAIKVAPPYC